MIMNVEYIWLTWLNEMQIISYCYVQIKVPPPSANDLNQLKYSRLPRPVPAPPRRFLPLPRPTPHRLEDFDPCLAPATETTAKSCARKPITLGWLLYTMLKPSKDQAYIWPYIWSNVTQKSFWALKSSISAIFTTMVLTWSSNHPENKAHILVLFDKLS